MATQAELATAAVEEQRALVDALKRELDYQADRQMEDIESQIIELQDRLTRIQQRKATLPQAIANAEAKLVELQQHRKVEHTPELKKLRNSKNKLLKELERSGMTLADLKGLANGK